MTYRPHLLLQAGGPLFTTEQWSINLRMSIGSGSQDPSGIVLDAWEQWTRDNIEDLHADVRAYVEDPNACFSSAAEHAYTKCNVIDTDGRYRNETETVAFYETITPLPDGTLAPGPAQNALVVSLLTDAARGRAHRGRYYIPCGVMAVDAATGRLSNLVLGSAVTAAQTFLNNLNNMPGIDVNNPRVVIASDLGAPGPMRDVTAVAIGNVLDTQRRRRNALPETYVEAPVTIVASP